METIPKIIHYCWFGNKEMPKKTRKLIESWKRVLPDYEIIEWNEEKFDIANSCSFVKEAYKNKKWAFVSDYVRLYALKNIGGIYLDTDVNVLKKFDKFLNDNFFISHESNVSLCTAVIGSNKDNKIISEFLHTYDNKHFEDSNKLNMTPNSELILQYFNSIGKNVKFDNEYQDLDIHIYPQTYFCGKDIHSYKILKTKNTVCIHNLDASWYSPFHKLMRLIKKIIRKIINK